MANAVVRENIYEVLYIFTIPIDLYELISRRYIREFAKSGLTFNKFYEHFVTDVEKRVIMSIEDVGDKERYRITFENVT